MAEEIIELVIEGKRLGRHIDHDPKSLNHPVTAYGPLKKILHRRYGKVLDQGQLGSCTGNAISGALNTVPTHKPKGKILTETDAVAIYEAATIIDGFPGQYPPTDTGSSGLAVCQVAKTQGYITSYQHAFSIDQALQALMLYPVITGVNWYEGFDSPDQNGLVQISGQVRGGHEFEVLGYNPATDLVTAVNSWGTGWGVSGRFHFTSKTWATLLSQQGDVTVPIR